MLALRRVQKVQVLEPARGQRVFTTVPLAGRGLIFMSCSTPAHGPTDRLVAVDRERLELVWSLPLSGEKRLVRVPAPVEAVSDRLLVLSSLSEVAVVDVEERRLVWRRAADAGWTMDGRVVRVHERRLEFLIPESGDLLSSLDLPGPTWRPFGRMVLCRGGEGRQVFFDPSTGAVLWDRDLNSEVRQAYGVGGFEQLGTQLGSHEDSAFASPFPPPEDEKGFLVGICLRDGSPRWKTDVPATHSALACAGRIYVLGFLRLMVLDESTGEVLQDVHHGMMVGHPQQGSVFRDRVVFTSEEGGVGLFDLGSGTPLWHENYGRVHFNGSKVVDDRLMVPASDGTVWVFEGTDKPQRKKTKPTPDWMKRMLPHSPDES